MLIIVTEDGKENVGIVAPQLLIMRALSSLRNHEDPNELTFLWGRSSVFTLLNSYSLAHVKLR